MFIQNSPASVYNSVAAFCVLALHYLGSQNSSVGIAADCELDVRHSIPGRARCFALLQSFQTGFGAHPVSFAMGTGPSFCGINRPELETDHSPTSSDKV
jgi:hypothetical protein